MKKLLLSIAVIVFALSTFAQTNLIISEYVEGWSTNKAIELYNPTNTAINLNEYRLVRYSNGADVPPADGQWTIDLDDFSLEPYKSYVVVLDKRDPEGTGQEAPVWSQLQQRADVFLCPVYAISKTMYFNGDDAVALEKTDGTLVDLFARWGAPRPAEASVGGSTLVLRCWTDTSPYFSGEGVGITADHTMIKKPTVNNGVTTNPTTWDPLADWDTLPANTFSNLGWHFSDVAPNNETPVFEKDKYAFSAYSNYENGKLIGTIKANDAESDAVKYYIEYGNFIYMGEGDDAVRIEPFELGKTNGELTLVDKTGLDSTVLKIFYLKILATDGFSQTNELTVEVWVDKEVGIKKSIPTQSEMSLFPNPTVNNAFKINTNKPVQKVIISNLIGQEVYSNICGLKRNISINIPDLQKGIYLVSVTMNDNSVVTQKVFLK